MVAVVQRGNKFMMSLGPPMVVTVNCADNMGEKNLYIISMKCIKGRLNRLPSACIKDMVIATLKNRKLDLRKNMGGDGNSMVVERKKKKKKKKRERGTRYGEEKKEEEGGC
ncbi:60S ribosomal protein L23 [Camellia lanceoleosa]|uniref:60S ribosomal protein L23 n=1 Tax=Camellia lanceoleosa TaxID=1840588 RepID=A0ACC0IGE0_9ERIC|nr:60S ribosomal protein L23 [Camellia lanceoleosa]